MIIKQTFLLSLLLLIVSCDQNKKITYELIDDRDKVITTSTIQYNLNRDGIVLKENKFGHGKNHFSEIDLISSVKKGQLFIKVIINETGRNVKKTIKIESKTPKSVKIDSKYKLKLKREQKDQPNS